MWGDPERAMRLFGGSSSNTIRFSEDDELLRTVLLQVTGPAHIPFQDPRWNELLHGYNVWVHVQEPSFSNNNNSNSSNNGPLFEQACRSLVQHAPRTSNVAALARHATQSIMDLISSLQQSKQQQLQSQQPQSIQQHDDFTAHLSMVSKTKLVCGTMNLLRLLVHSLVVLHQSQQQSQRPDGGDYDDGLAAMGVENDDADSSLMSFLQEVFTYQNRDSGRDDDTAGPLLQAILQLLTTRTIPNIGNYHSTTKTKTATTLPEFYDATLLAQLLLLILLSTQLYQPFTSSFQRLQYYQNQQNQNQQSSYHHGLFWNMLMKQAATATALGNSGSRSQSKQQQSTLAVKKATPISSTTTTHPRILLATFLDQITKRPVAPRRSIAHSHAALAKAIAHAKSTTTTATQSNLPTVVMGADGLYETHWVVTAAAKGKKGSSQQQQPTAEGAGESSEHDFLLSSYSSVFDGMGGGELENGDNDDSSADGDDDNDGTAENMMVADGGNNGGGTMTTTTRNDSNSLFSLASGIASAVVSSSTIYEAHRRKQKIKERRLKQKQRQKQKQQMMQRHRRGGSNILLDATKGVLVLSSTIILLPFRLMSLALHLIAAAAGSGGAGRRLLHHPHSSSSSSSWLHRSAAAAASNSCSAMNALTKDVLWVSESPVADLATCLFLLLTNNERASAATTTAALSNNNNNMQSTDNNNSNNPFRQQLAQLQDNYHLPSSPSNHPTTALPDLPDFSLLGNYDLNNNNVGGTVGGNSNSVYMEEGETEPLIMSTAEGDIQQRYDDDEDNNDFKNKMDDGETTTDPAVCALTIPFEALFESFGRTTHTEVGALLLYTLLQASEAFSQSMAVRSDLDTVVMPLLRTLYFATASTQHFAADSTSTSTTKANESSSQTGWRRPSLESASSQTSASSTSSSPSVTATHSAASAQPQTAATTTTSLSIRSCPFRSQSQLYVIVILLLLFSQDASFGPDAFRRAIIAGNDVPWYKERLFTTVQQQHGEEADDSNSISLGSMLILCLLRSLVFCLNRFPDAFLLSNCCAVLMNLSPSMTGLHEYAAMRLVAVTISTMKRFAALHREQQQLSSSSNANNTNNNNKTSAAGEEDAEDEMSTPLGMHAEVARTLLRVLKQALSPKNFEGNVHLVYALIYHQMEFKKIICAKDSPFRKSEWDRILKVTTTASSTLEQAGGDARTAAKALVILSENMEFIRQSVTAAEQQQQQLQRRKHSHQKEKDEATFTFTYEEEADPEIFFVPYLWEVIVCCATSSLIEWKKSKIRVFPLLDDPEAVEAAAAAAARQYENESTNATAAADATSGVFSNDVSDVV